MFSSIVKRSLFFLSFFLLLSTAFAEPKWQALSPGLQQASWTAKDASGNSFTLELFKVDTKQYKLQLVQSSDYQMTKMSVKDMVLKSGALLGINGGFFDPQYKPIGLLVRDGKTLNPFKAISWWGVFSYDKSQGASVDRLQSFEPKASTEVAIQAGPRLVDESRVMPLKKNDSQKTFVGIVSPHQVILGVTNASSVDALDLAKILRKELGLKEVLNFDGGSSTQLYAKLGHFEKDLPNFSGVPNGLVVLPRK